MKCPKCDYLAFESGDRCRNCGYEFSLTAAAPAFDVELDSPPEPRPPLDLERIIGEVDSDAVVDLPLFSPPGGEFQRAAPTTSRVRHGLSRTAIDDAPLITTPAAPRAPLGVRRATPEIPRARAKTPPPAHADTLFAMPVTAAGERTDRRPVGNASGDSLAGPVSRIMAGLVDVTLLAALDAVVVYFTVRLLGLPAADVVQLPLLPLAAFFLLLNGGYFIAFTAVGGQSIGKMALGIKVIGQEEGSVPVGRATVRTLAYLVSALPLGAGFFAGVFSPDRLALHDRLAHTRVVRPSST